jgi:steroid 5-alpha reductase family enzyme
MTIDSGWGLIASALIALMAMLLTYQKAKKIDNFSIVDVTWSLNFTLISICFTLLSTGSLVHRVCLLLVIAAWSLRLAWHLHRRIDGKPEEGRYVELRRKWSVNGTDAFLHRMRRFYYFQAISNVILALPMWVISNNQTPELTPLEICGFILMIISIWGEATADRQLSAFKAQQHNIGRVCNQGLWKYSRHPNYFFEWCVWVGLSGVSLSCGWWGLTGPIMAALMLYLLLKVTGIKATEDQNMRSKGAEYAHYQRTTSSFIPWFKRFN